MTFGVPYIMYLVPLSLRIAALNAPLAADQLSTEIASICLPTTADGLESSVYPLEPMVTDATIGAS